MFSSFLKQVPRVKRDGSSLADAGSGVANALHSDHSTPLHCVGDGNSAGCGLFLSLPARLSFENTDVTWGVSGRPNPLELLGQSDDLPSGSIIYSKKLLQRQTHCNGISRYVQHGEY